MKIIKEAEEVVLAPVPIDGQRIEFRTGIENIREKLKHPLTHDDKIVIPGIVNFGTMLKFEVIKPLKGVFCIVGNTLVKLSNGID